VIPLGSAGTRNINGSSSPFHLLMRNRDAFAKDLAAAVLLGINPIITLEKQLLNTIENLV
jgi:hypothetical protein